MIRRPSGSPEEEGEGRGTELAVEKPVADLSP